MRLNLTHPRLARHRARVLRAFGRQGGWNVDVLLSHPPRRTRPSTVNP
ncbi:MAG: hypothetical protein U0P81_11580 [Holophagaceae bacterium]